MPSLSEIAALLDAKLVGDESLQVSSINSLGSANEQALSYLSGEKHLPALKNTQAGVVILRKDHLTLCPTNALVVDDPYLAFAKISHLFDIQPSALDGISPSANIANAKIGSNVAIGENVVLGNNCIIGANTTIGANTSIGNDAFIHDNVSIMHNSIIGNEVEIFPGAVIGADGFGNARDQQGKWHKIAHLGSVIIGNQVSIGANTTIDRGTLENTKIDDGVRIDNLVHIAHNVSIGEDSAIAACTGIAGSTTLGKRCMIGGMVGIVGHLNICDDVVVNATSTVDKDISKPGVYTGIFPLMPHKRWQNIGIWLTKLDKIVKHLNIKLKNLKEN